MFPFRHPEPYIKMVKPNTFGNKNWTYARITPEITVAPNGCKTFVLSEIGTSTYTSAISSVTNGTYDGLKVVPIDNESDVVVCLTTYTVGGDYNIQEKGEIRIKSYT